MSIQCSECGRYNFHSAGCSKIGSGGPTRYAIPRQTRKLLNSTNGFTLGKPYPLVQVNKWGSAHVINDNGHNRFIPTDGGSNAHLQYRYGLEAHCAGVFDIVDIVTDYVHPPIPIRSHDWQAWIDGSEEDGDYGWGPTREDAVRDLARMIANGETRFAQVDYQKIKRAEQGYGE